MASNSKEASNSNEGEEHQERPRRQIPLHRKLLFSAITVIAFFGSIELLLRVAGFEMNQSVERMEFTFPIEDYNESAPEPFLVRDNDLFWRPRAGVMDHNSLGFYGPEFSREKEAGKIRIVCLGDSCTHFGPQSYPDMLRLYLDDVAPGKFDVINAGVIGYTSFQGKRLLQKEVLGWSPDIVTVYFGWNDHWLGRGVADKDQVVQSSPMVDALRGSRVFQLTGYLFGGAVPVNRDMMRVAKDDYFANLKEIVDQCQQRDIDVWFLTAAHAFDLGIPPYLVESGEVSDPDQLVPLHESYNEVVRRVASAGGAALIDIAEEMESMNKSELFIDDHIHLSPPGRLHVAKRLTDTLRSKGLLVEDAGS